MSTFAIAAVIVLLASTVQAISGFGFGLLTVPLLAHVIGPRDAIVVSAAANLFSSSQVAWRCRAALDRRIFARLFASNLLGMPIGLLLFAHLSEEMLKVLIGVVTLAFVLLLASGWQLRTGSNAIEYVAGWISGALATSVGAAGPPLVVALTARRVNPDVQRPTLATTLFAQKVITVPLLLATFAHQPGYFDRSPVSLLTLSAALFPAIVLGSMLGHRVGHGVDEERFRQFTLILLAAAGVLAISGAFS